MRLPPVEQELRGVGAVLQGLVNQKRAESEPIDDRYGNQNFRNAIELIDCFGKGLLFCALLRGAFAEMNEIVFFPGYEFPVAQHGAGCKHQKEETHHWNRHRNQKPPGKGLYSKKMPVGMARSELLKKAGEGLRKVRMAELKALL